jgi:uncharacterized membrane protein
MGVITIKQSVKIFVLYPVLPYLGLICIGYAAGKLYSPEVDSAKRRKLLFLIGISSIGAFIVLRYSNLYGDPTHWEHQIAPRYTVLSFINCTKYPVSLLFALMTLGPSILFLSVFEGIQNGITKVLTTIGRVPMFYYIIHLYLIHTIAFITENTDMTTPFHLHNRFHLWTVYLIWFGVVGTLYFPCLWYGKYKSAHPDWKWLSYL